MRCSHVIKSCRGRVLACTCVRMGMPGAAPFQVHLALAAYGFRASAFIPTRIGTQLRKAWSAANHEHRRMEITAPVVMVEALLQVIRVARGAHASSS